MGVESTTLWLRLVANVWRQTSVVLFQLWVRNPTAKVVQCADDLNVSSERFHCVRKQYIFWRFTLSTGHGVDDILNKRLDESGDALCLILVIRISTETRKHSRWFGMEIWPQTAIFSKEWASCPVGWLIESEWKSDLWCWQRSLRIYFLVESFIRSIPPDNMNDYSFHIKKVIGTTFLLGMMSFPMYSNRFVNTCLSITWYRSSRLSLFPRCLLLCSQMFLCYLLYNSYSMICDSGPLRKLYLCLLLLESFHLLFELHNCIVFWYALSCTTFMWLRTLMELALVKRCRLDRNLLLLMMISCIIFYVCSQYSQPFR